MEKKELAVYGIEMAQHFGASYSDIRIVEVEEESLSVVNDKVESIKREESYGLGIRVLKNQAWGFASSPELNKKEIEKIARESCRIANASSKLRKDRIKLCEIEKISGTYRTPYKIDPFSVSFEEKIESLMGWNWIMKRVNGITEAKSFMNFRKERRFFASSEGSLIEQEILHSGTGIEATALKSRKEFGKRSYPVSGGQFESKGYELISEIGCESNAERIANEAVALLTASETPSGEKNIIIDGNLLSLVIHESIGHPLELDRVFGSEQDFSGTSFATTEKLGKFKYASKIVNVVSDATYPSGLGSFGYDDEGVPAQRVELVREGVLVGYLTSRETAMLIGNKRSSGAMRAENWGSLPLIRMTNTNLLPSDKSLGEIVKETDDGIFIEGVSSWSIDDRREKFKFGGEIAWEIKNGKLGNILKNPRFSGDTLKFWNSCDAIADKGSFKIWGTPNCGKGQPGQNMRTGQGASAARFIRVKIG